MLARLPLVATLAVAAIPAAPVHRAEDHAGLMSESARAALDARLGAYEHATGHQVVIWIGKTLGGAALDDWAVQTFAAWKLGRSGLDDGVAIFVLADDRNVDIEVGYGLEDKVPDAVASRIIREIMAPRLRANDADGAITAGADALLTAIEGHAWSPGASPTSTRPATATWVIGGLVAAALLILLIVNPRLALWLLWIAARAIGGGGDGDGGFGGGGGRSGGGGARGGW